MPMPISRVWLVQRHTHSWVVAIGTVQPAGQRCWLQSRWRQHLLSTACRALTGHGTLEFSGKVPLPFGWELDKCLESGSSWIISIMSSFFKIKILFIYFLEGREQKWERNSHQLHVPWPGIKPATFRFAGQYPTHWATPAKAITGS